MDSPRLFATYLAGTPLVSSFLADSILLSVIFGLRPVATRLRGMTCAAGFSAERPIECPFPTAGGGPLLAGLRLSYVRPAAWVIVHRELPTAASLV